MTDGNALPLIVVYDLRINNIRSDKNSYLFLGIY